MSSNAQPQAKSTGHAAAASVMFAKEDVLEGKEKRAGRGLIEPHSSSSTREEAKCLLGLLSR
jgi:hypothetical protein